MLDFSPEDWLLDHAEELPSNYESSLPEKENAKVGQGSEMPHNRGLTVFTHSEFLGLELPTREYILEPILGVKSLSMIFAARGGGKTFFALGLAYAIATGSEFLKYEAPKSRKVLVIDGEMPAPDLQERLKQLGPPSDNLRLLPMDAQQDNNLQLNLAKVEYQRLVESYIGDTEVLVLDNRSTLVYAATENEAQSWDSMQRWLLRLRRKGVSVIIIEHAGRSGEARGTSKREDVLDTIINLKRPLNYHPEDGARFEIHLTKARHLYGESTSKFEATMQVRDDGTAEWLVCDVSREDEQRVYELTGQGHSVRDISSETGMSKSKVNRIQKKGRGKGLLERK